MYTKDKKYCNVRDHCHYEGIYREAAHRIYNLKYNLPNEIPLVFQNTTIILSLKNWLTSWKENSSV